jgi:hypothetical protein
MTVPDLTGRRAPSPGTKTHFSLIPPTAGIPASFPLILLALLLVLAAVPLSNPPRAGPKPEPAPVPLPVQVESRIATEGLDQHQRRLPFTVYVLSQELSWKLESVTDLEGEQALLIPELAEAIDGAQDVFCIGTASFEGRTAREEARAAQRARTLGDWVKCAIKDPGKTRLFTVNAGQYRGPEELASSKQRKAIIIVTQGHADDVDLGDALRSGLEKKQQEYPVVASLLRHYSRSDEWLKLLK